MRLVVQQALIILLALTTFVPGVARADIPPFSQLHLDLDMAGPEYRSLFDNLRRDHGLLFNNGNDLEAILDIGKRNLDWLALVNSQRSPDHQLELTTAESTVAIPITAPRSSNPTIIRQSRDEIRAS